MFGTIGIVFFLIIYLLIQNNSMKKLQGERKKVYIMSAVTIGSTLFFIIPYKPGRIIEYINLFFSSITKLVVGG
jgi:hypothetical protein